MEQKMEKTLLVVKNLPDTCPEGYSNALQYFQYNFGAISLKSFGRRRAIIQFPNEQLATMALHRLHQTEIGNRIISVEYLGRRKMEDSVDLEEVKKSENIRISDNLKILYALSDRFNFEQPPPPYLRYNYPKINRNILDSISIALMSNRRFYTQVLHLMNRMNLEPPFGPFEREFTPPGDLVDAETQTDFQTSLQQKTSLLSSDESELESDDESREKLQSLNNKRNLKRRKELDENMIKEKARKILTSTRLLNPQQKQTLSGLQENLNEMFEIHKSSKKMISLNVATVQLPQTVENLPVENIDNKGQEEVQESEETGVRSIVTNATEKITSIEDFKQNRIPEEQMKNLPVFKNYQKGEKSNKLYIKNLHKDVTEEDIHNIYSLFLEDSNQSIFVKLMQFGRMKGQAFVTFNAVENDKFDIVEKALLQTNGFIFKTKPMIVCYGKK